MPLFALLSLWLSWCLSSSSFADQVVSTVPDSLSVSGGISTPSWSTAAIQNPAVLIRIPQLQTTAQLGWDRSFNQGSYQGGIAYGNRNVGFSVGYNVSSRQMYSGLAFGVKGASVGLSTLSSINGSSMSQFKAGVLISPSDEWSFGFTSHAFNTSAPEWGLGTRLRITRFISGVIDVSSRCSLSDFQAQPGLLFGNDSLSFTVSYGTGPGSLQLSSGFAAGGSFILGPNLHWQVYYNQLNPIATVISLKI